MILHTAHNLETLSRDHMDSLHAEATRARLLAQAREAQRASAARKETVAALRPAATSKHRIGSSSNQGA